MKNHEASASSGLTSGKLLAKNTLWNLVGQGVPLITAVFAIPFLIKGLGIERFGVLTLAWMVIGYFSLFDLGLGRALTQLVSAKLGAGDEAQIPRIVWTATTCATVFAATSGSRRKTVSRISAASARWPNSSWKLA